ncbi:glycosyltransferase family 2 protein [Antarcticimicrobium sediminis]|uniref:Glycosyltransferase family 2 protein n=1 Tax=Antarcticimicrobium sediminis TaxID=2546227 RepID=A0A4R5EYN5_9RHOB|nr:glycosyltransferase family 2 protein [Antarcticimicrobium sediminis]TDE40228.1 glycosyltransferase family 2 protein [Antarcticimicrobium sediminis]
MTTWGLVATIKAPVREILDFAAHHIELGAHRLYLFLDAPNPEAQATLKPHPKVRVFTCDEAHWNRLGIKRPVKHQVRQAANATHAYHRKGGELDWLIHMDVDEFLWPDNPLANLLDALPADALCARIRPAEALAGDGTLFKGFIPGGPERAATVARLYPRFGAHVKGGFLSHVAGKLFVRTGIDPLEIRIHNVFRGAEMNPGEVALATTLLLHCHAKSWEDWIAAYRYRLSHGSYRAELAPARPRDKGGLTLHEVLSEIEASEGDSGLRAFYDELCVDSPALCSALDAAGLLHRCELQLDAKRQKQFPDFPKTVSQKT